MEENVEQCQMKHQKGIQIDPNQKRTILKSKNYELPKSEDNKAEDPYMIDMLTNLEQDKDDVQTDESETNKTKFVIFCIRLYIHEMSLLLSIYLVDTCTAIAILIGTITSMLSEFNTLDQKKITEGLLLIEIATTDTCDILIVFFNSLVIIQIIMMLSWTILIFSQKKKNPKSNSIPPIFIDFNKFYLNFRFGYLLFAICFNLAMIAFFLLAHGNYSRQSDTPSDNIYSGFCSIYYYIAQIILEIWQFGLAKPYNVLINSLEAKSDLGLDLQTAVIPHARSGNMTNHNEQDDKEKVVTGAAIIKERIQRNRNSVVGERETDMQSSEYISQQFEFGKAGNVQSDYDKGNMKVIIECDEEIKEDAVQYTDEDTNEVLHPSSPMNLVDNCE